LLSTAPVVEPTELVADALDNVGIDVASAMNTVIHHHNEKHLLYYCTPD